MCSSDLTFHFPAGKHVLQVRVVSPASGYDQIETLGADFSANSQRVLVVNCDKRKMQVALQDPQQTEKASVDAKK